MTCKQCVHHEKFHDEAFYCESINDLMEEDENFDAEQCRWFAPLIVEGDEQDVSCTDTVGSASLADGERKNA